MLKFNSNARNYLSIILLHAFLGLLFFLFPFFAKVYCAAILVVGAYFIIKNKNRNEEALYAAAYIVGAEVLLRMTGGNLLYEIGKYGVIIFIVLGMFFKGFSKNAVAYWFYLVLLIPGVVIAITDLDYNEDLRKSITFNISGPLALGIAALYTYQRKISSKQIDDLLLAIGLPIISCATYLFFYVPDVQDVITSTQSNFEMSGGFGPNQVATILGLGVFIYFSRMLFCSTNSLILLINLLIALMLAFRGLVTFSRGGMITGLVMLLILLLFTSLKINRGGKLKVSIFLLFISISLLGVFTYSSIKTSGLITNRYANQDALGRVKESQFSGREEIIKSEIGFFMRSPIFGVGVAMGAKLRNEASGLTILSHNEITRMLAEHGSLGILALFILLFTPVVLYLDNSNNLYLFCFLAFWLLTINHAAMRLAAPGFIYALALLKVIRPDEKNPLPRKQIRDKR